MAVVNLNHHPHGWLRFGLRLPIWLYRLHLGWLLGNRFLLLTHTGRLSGEPRQTVVEVVNHNPRTDVYYVVSGWGARADWYRNLSAHPQATIEVGARRLQVLAQPVPLPEAIDILEAYTYRSPTAFGELTSLFLGQPLLPGRAAAETLAERMPMLAFVPQTVEA